MHGDSDQITNNLSARIISKTYINRSGRMTPTCSRDENI